MYLKACKSYTGTGGGGGAGWKIEVEYNGNGWEWTGAIRNHRQLCMAWRVCEVDIVQAFRLGHKDTRRNKPRLLKIKLQDERCKGRLLVG